MSSAPGTTEKQSQHSDPQWLEDSFKELRDSLQCGICSSLLSNPSTLSCTHSFCNECIVEYNKNNWTCPRCNVPMGTAPIKPNPQLQSIVSSYNVIMKSIHDAINEGHGSCNGDSNVDIKTKEITMKKKRKSPESYR